MSQSFISETRQPFERRGDRSCVYYGIRGNARSQYMFDKSCGFEGGSLADEVISPVGVLWNGSGLGAGVMPVINGPMPTLLGYQELSARMPTLLQGQVSLLKEAMSSPRVTLLGPGRPTLLSGQGVMLLGDPMSTQSKVLLGLGVAAALAGTAYAFRSKIWGKKRRRGRGRRR